MANQVADGKIAISAFVGAPMGVPDQTVGKLFTPIEVSTLYYDAERVGRECAASLCSRAAAAARERGVWVPAVSLCVDLFLLVT